MSIDDFNEQDDENVKEIIDFLENSGLDLRSTCQTLNMKEEQIDLTILLFAKKYYLQGSYEQGEEFLKSFEKSKNKTQKTINLYNEIVKNKNLYIN